MKYSRKTTAVFLVFSLIAGIICGMPATMAANGPPGETKDETVELSDITRHLSIEFMGRGATPQATSPGKAKLTETDVNNTFWVGIAADNLDSLTLFTNGVYSLETAFEYDSDYIQPALNFSSLTELNLVSTGDTSGWDITQYEITTATDTAIDTEGDREDADKLTERSGWKMSTVCVRAKQNPTQELLRFYGHSSTDKQYLLKIPFRLVKMPDLSENSDPKLLSFVRGSSTFDIGAGADGLSPFASWEASGTDETDMENLKNLFTFDGDISLFTTSSGIEDLSVIGVPKPAATADPSATADPAETEEPTAEPEVYPLSQSKELSEEGFNSSVYEYYVSVLNETEEVTLDITTSDKPTVTANGASVNAAEDDGVYKTAAIALKELTADSENDGFDNTVAIEAGGMTYTVYIRRLLKPKIVLNYGNSPYGEIMKAENIAAEDKDAAKEAFNTGNKFTSAYLPTGCNIDNKYPIGAWGNSTDSSLNMDRNDYALFIYNGESFKDPGFIAYDSMGNEVEAENIKRSMTVNLMANGGVAYMLDTEVVEDSTLINGIIGESQYEFTQLASKKVRPDIYEMKYTFTDDYGSEATVVTSNLYQYRITDVNLSNVVDGTDKTVLTRIIKGLVIQDRLYNVIN